MNSYTVGDVVYLRETAALGRLEAVRISTLTMQNGQWVYSVQAHGVPGLGDRRSLINNVVLYYDESELITLADALEIAEANLTQQLTRIQQQRASLS